MSAMTRNGLRSRSHRRIASAPAAVGAAGTSPNPSADGSGKDEMRLPGTMAVLRFAVAVAAGGALLLLASGAARAETREYDIVVDEGNVDIAGVSRRALTLNGGVPGPTLRFTVGDEAVIRVRNELDTETSIHWHGILLPNDQDGVPYLTTPPIEAGTTRTFRFPLTHAGTYWYHSHTGLQEQRGVYGSIVITPDGGEPVKTDHDRVIVLSDWTDEDPGEVMRTLMRGSEWYSIRKGTLPTILGAWREGRLGAYFDGQWNRMPPMDVSDVAYDAFLANGQESLRVDAAPGETVRLRFINAGSSTNFFLQSATGPLTIVAADGPAVKPLAVDGFMIAIAETYDVVVTVPAEGTWEVRATSQDTTGHASVLLGSGPLHPARDIPGADLYTMDHMMGAAMDSLGPGMAMDHGDMKMPATPARPLSPYRGLRAVVPSRAAPEAPRRDLEMHLTGDMTRYIWSFDGKTLAEESTVAIRRGEVLRLTLVNDTMMNHPIHLHGHFFRVLDGDDDEAPLKHTVDVPPMGRRTIEIDANESGDWLFHCHVLYHMDSGMTRVFTYGPADHVPSLDPGMMGTTVVVGQVTALTNMAMGHAMVMSGREDFGVEWDVSYGHDTEYEVDGYWSHYFDENVTAFVGGRLTNEHEANDRMFAGGTYRLPLLVRARLEGDSRGDVRFGVEKSLQLTDRLELMLGARYDTGSRFEGRVSLDYRLTKQWSLSVGARTDHGIGAGLTLYF